MKPIHDSILRRRRFRYRAGLSLAALLTVAVTWLLAHEGHATLPTKGAQVDVSKGQVILSREARAALDVRTAEVDTRPVSERLLTYASLVAPWRQHAFATSLLAGRITALHAQPGQTVVAGDSLAEVESADLENLQLELLNARNDAELSAKVLEEVDAANRSGSAAEQTLLESRTKNRQSANALEVARGKWLSLGLSADALEALLRERKPVLRSLTVRSPIGGTVIHADLAVGKVIDPTEHLFEIVDLSKVWVQIGVLEQDLNRVEVGQPVEIRLAAYPGEVFTATVRVLSDALDPRTHLVTAWAELPNPPDAEPRFLPGMSGEARLILSGPAAGTAVPAEALISDGAEQYVFVEEAATAANSQYQKRNVVVGRKGRDRVEVRSGQLVPGDRVVTQGGHELAGFFVPGVLRPSPEAVRNKGVRVEAARPEAIDDVIEIDGAVDLPPGRRAVASSPLPGMIHKVQAERGQHVRAGDVLAEVVSLELQTLQLDLLRAHLETLLFDETWQGLRRGNQRGAVPRRRMLEVESQLNASRQQRDTLVRKLRAVGLSAGHIDGVLTKKALVETLPVRSPIDGYVVGFDRVLGQAIKAEEPILGVHDLSHPWVQGFVSERDVARTRLGQRVRVRLEADPDFLAEGKVVRSGRVFGSDDRTLSVWVEFDRPPASPLRYGQLARLAVSMGQSGPTLAVPLSAVWWDGTQPYLFVRKDDGTFERRAVETGRSDDRRVEIARGLQPGESVVVQGTEGLQTAFAVVR
jgi:cobalt-zinc-cadmium efflux system membrane fusion protein